jgi:hypothetical protein
MQTFQNFPDATQYGQQELKRTRRNVVYVLVHTHKIAVYADGWCHACLYQARSVEVLAA